MKKFFLLIILVIGLLVLAFWSPWYDWNINIMSLFGIQNSISYSSLKVKSLEGKFDIYLDDELLGSADSLEGYSEFNDIKPGDHTIKLYKDDDHYQFVQKLTFEEDMEVLVGYDLGPSQVFSEGHIMYTKKNYFKREKPYLEILSDIPEIEVTIDSDAPLIVPVKNFELDITKQHTIKFSKDGYDPMEITILSDKQEEREKLQEYDITLKAALFLRPINIE